MQTFLEVPLLPFNVKPFVDKDCMCSMLGSSTLRRGGNKRNKLCNRADTFEDGCSL